MATLTRTGEDHSSVSCVVPLGENEASIVDHWHFLEWVDAGVAIGHVLELSQGDGLRFERDASQFKEDVQSA